MREKRWGICCVRALAVNIILRMCVCVCVCVCARARACVCVRVRVPASVQVWGRSHSQKHQLWCSRPEKSWFPVHALSCPRTYLITETNNYESAKTSIRFKTSSNGVAILSVLLCSLFVFSPFPNQVIRCLQGQGALPGKKQSGRPCCCHRQQ